MVAKPGSKFQRLPRKVTGPRTRIGARISACAAELVVESRITVRRPAPRRARVIMADGGNADNGAKLFKAKCSTCHTCNEGGPNKQGPNLYGVIGRQSGQVSGFKYTAANKNSNITWSNQTLFECVVHSAFEHAGECHSPCRSGEDGRALGGEVDGHAPPAWTCAGVVRRRWTAVA